MNKPIIILLIFSLNILAVACLAQSNSGSTKIATESTNYSISRYVIASGGIQAGNSNNFMMATAGETVAGGVSNSDYFLYSGYWNPLFGTETNVAKSDLVGIPKSFAVYQNYPNPFNPQTSIKYDLPSRCLVTVEIYNVIGQRISLISSQIQGPGNFQIEWYGMNDHGKMVESGIYFYRVTARKNDAEQTGTDVLFQQINKMLLVK